MRFVATLRVLGWIALALALASPAAAQAGGTGDGARPQNARGAGIPGSGSVPERPEPGVTGRCSSRTSFGPQARARSAPSRIAVRLPRRTRVKLKQLRTRTRSAAASSRPPRLHAAGGCFRVVSRSINRAAGSATSSRRARAPPLPEQESL